MAIDGTRKKIGLKEDFSFGMRKERQAFDSISNDSLDPKFVSDGVRVRCRLEIKPDEKPEEKVVSPKESSLIEDLRTEIGTQFSDFTLVCGERRSTVFFWQHDPRSSGRCSKT